MLVVLKILPCDDGCSYIRFKNNLLSRKQFSFINLGGKKHPCNSLFNDLKDKIPIFICFFNLPAKETHICYIRFFISMPKVSVLGINWIARNTEFNRRDCFKQEDTWLSSVSELMLFSFPILLSETLPPNTCEFYISDQRPKLFSVYTEIIP